MHRAAARYLSGVRGFVEHLAKTAGLADARAFAAAWHMLMQGAITSAAEGNPDAARDAKRAGATLLSAWRRRASPSS
ncbi:MAG: hypothetical protein FJX54_06485 [Alphaproteobacteria bacterium]|nr:hypothetical protein [Alphaproteobacteria bacterium]